MTKPNQGVVEATYSDTIDSKLKREIAISTKPPCLDTITEMAYGADLFLLVLCVTYHSIKVS